MAAGQGKASSRGRWRCCLGLDFYFASPWDFIHFIMFGRTKGKGADLKPIKKIGPTVTGMVRLFYQVISIYYFVLLFWYLFSFSLILGWDFIFFFASS